MYSKPTALLLGRCDQKEKELPAAASHLDLLLHFALAIAQWLVARAVLHWPVLPGVDLGLLVRFLFLFSTTHNVKLRVPAHSLAIPSLFQDLDQTQCHSVKVRCGLSINGGEPGKLTGRKAVAIFYFFPGLLFPGILQSSSHRRPLTRAAKAPAKASERRRQRSRRTGPSLSTTEIACHHRTILGPLLSLKTRDASCYRS
ncbi:hypothetical protein GE09DRAFT_34012 [Coniochaeta sp. 2T2.1]|nr:hypothetical protein GE09DRAFT_34012 [Coniochaeta sp. 2T2.1]